jgi:hypothetical protein
MHVADDPVLLPLNDIVRMDSAVALVTETLRRVCQQLDASTKLMAWDIVPLTAFGGRLPESIRSCWIFVIRANATTGAERHPNSHQRSISLIGSGTFEVRAGAKWDTHALVSTDRAELEQRWVSIPPSTWHRLLVGPETWGMLSFHTVAPEELIEENPVDMNNLAGQTRQERYAGRR